MTGSGTAGIGPSALYYEQFAIGDYWQSPSRTITDTDAMMFAALSGDLSSLCFDVTAVANCGGRRINTACALALATGLEQRLGLKEGTGIAFLGATWRCHRALREGDTVRIEQRVKSKRTTKNEECGVVAFDVSLEGQHDEKLYHGIWTLMIRRNPALLSVPPREEPILDKPGETVVAGDLAHRKFHHDHLNIGQSWTTPRRTVTTADISGFCGLTGDYNPAHSDIEFAQSSPFGERVLQGPAGLAIALGLKSRLDLGGDTDSDVASVDWSFRAPIFAGDTLQVALEVNAKPSPSVVLLEATIRNQRNVVVQTGEWTIVAR